MGPLTWSFDTWSGCGELDHETTPLTVVAPCIWHGSGTNLSRRQSATTAGASTDQARVCLAAPPPASAALPACVVDQRKPRRPAPLRRCASPQLGNHRLGAVRSVLTSSEVGQR